MKHAKRFRLLFIGLLLLGYTSLLAAPTGYQLDWFSLDGGGGVAGGKPDTGTVQGRGGTWRRVVPLHRVSQNYRGSVRCGRKRTPIV